MKEIQLNYNGIKKFVTSQELSEYESKTTHALKALLTKTGEGQDYTGWVDYPMEIQEKELMDIVNTSKTMRQLGNVLVVIGIGGSYLGSKAAIEMLSNYYKNNDYEVIFLGNNCSSSYLKDTLDYLRNVDFCCNVISKSGKTLEPAIAFRFVKELMIEKYKDNYFKRVFVTTSDSNSIVHDEALKLGYLEFYIPKSIGGRYSVLTAVGLLPIAFMGFDIYDLVKGAINSYQDFTNLPFMENPCLQYAAIRNILYNKNYTNEILVTYEPKLHYIGEWWKQLFGESEGKNNLGLLPVSLTYSTDLHSLGQYVQDGMRNLFETVLDIENENSTVKFTKNEKNYDGLNYLQDKDMKFVKDQILKGTMEAHISGGVPNLLLTLKNISSYSFGYLVYFFMLSCGVSGYLLGVNPFNQEGVEAYKKNTFALLKK